MVAISASNKTTILVIYFNRNHITSLLFSRANCKGLPFTHVFPDGVSWRQLLVLKLYRNTLRPLNWILVVSLYCHYGNLPIVVLVFNVRVKFKCKHIE